MNKFDLKDLSICIPIRYDSEDRITNLKTVIRYFEKYFINFEFLILEEENDDIQHVPQEIADRPDVNFEFRPNKSFLHRTRMLNELAAKSTRKFITPYDVDILLPPESWITSIQILEKEDRFIFPYNGVFIDVKGPDRAEIIKTLELPKENVPHTIKLYKKWGNEFHVIHNKSVGGVYAFRRETYLKYGGFNREMKSWGYNDSEITIRFTKMGFTPMRINMPLYHLNHQRGIDSTPKHPRLNDNRAILNKVNVMSRENLEKYIKEKLV